MQESTSPNYRYLKYSTMVLFAAGMAGAYLLLRRVPARGDVFWPAFAGMAMPGAIIAGLFVYKCRVGIKNIRLGLSRWALFVSITILPYHALAWFYDRSRYPVFAAAMIAAQLANLVLAAGPLRRQAGFLTMPFAYVLNSFALQFIIMLAITLK
jgi:hypothetical protein